MPAPRRSHWITAAVTVATLLVAACSGSDDAASVSSTEPDPPPPTSAESTTTTAAATTTTSAPPPTTVVATTTTTMPATTTTEPAATTTVPPGLPAGFAISLGTGGGPDALTYSDELDESEVNGPGALAVDPTGTIHVVDPVADRIVSIRDGRLTPIDLRPLEVGYLHDVVATDDHLLVLDFQTTTLAPSRVLRVGYDGSLLEAIEIAENLDPLVAAQGLVDTRSDRVVLHFLGADGYRFAEWDPAARSWITTSALTVEGARTEQVDHDILLGDLLVTADAVPENEWWSSMQYRGRADDGTWVLLRFDGTESVEWWSTSGDLLGAAALPAPQTVTGMGRRFATTRDGRVLVLHTRPDEVVIREIERGAERVITPPSG